MAFDKGNQVVCEDGRESVVDRKHDGREAGPHGEFYAVLFNGVSEWQPEANLKLVTDAAKDAWLAARIASAAARSAQAAADNVERGVDGKPLAGAPV